MFDLSGVDWNNVANGVLFFVVVVLGWVGKRKAEGKTLVPGLPQPSPAPTTAITPAVEINALVDSSTLKAHANAIMAMTEAMTDGQKANKEVVEHVLRTLDELSKSARAISYAIDKNTLEIDRLKNEIRLNTVETIRSNHR